MAEAPSPSLPTIEAELDTFDAIAAAIERESLNSIHTLHGTLVLNLDDLLVCRLADNRLQNL